MIQQRTPSPAALAAESRACSTEEAEQQAEQRFDAARTALALVGRVHEATRSQEFQDWMNARHATDDAWGQWAMAMDASAARA